MLQENEPEAVRPEISKNHHLKRLSRYVVSNGFFGVFYTPTTYHFLISFAKIIMVKPFDLVSIPFKITLY